MPAVEGAARTAERAADIIATERRAAVNAISADLARTIEFAQRERLAVLEYLTLERKTAIDDLRKTITEEHEAVVSDTEQVAVRLVDRAMDRLERLVLKVVGLLLVAVFVALLMMRLFFRRPQTPSGRRGSPYTGWQLTKSRLSPRCRQASMARSLPPAFEFRGVQTRYHWPQGDDMKTNHTVMLSAIPSES